MRTFNQEETSNRFTKLPENVQMLILSDEIANAIGQATASANIAGEMKKECVQQITLVCVGLSTTKDFHEYIQNNLTLPEELATTFEEDVSQHIFGPIKRTLLKALENINNAPEAPLPENYTVQTNAEETVDPYKETAAK